MRIRFYARHSGTPTHPDTCFDLGHWYGLRRREGRNEIQWIGRAPSGVRRKSCASHDIVTFASTRTPPAGNVTNDCCMLAGGRAWPCVRLSAPSIQTAWVCQLCQLCLLMVMGGVILVHRLWWEMRSKAENVWRERELLGQTLRGRVVIRELKACRVADRRILKTNVVGVNAVSCLP